MHIIIYYINDNELSKIAVMQIGLNVRFVKNMMILKIYIFHQMVKKNIIKNVGKNIIINRKRYNNDTMKKAPQGRRVHTYPLVSPRSSILS